MNPRKEFSVPTKRAAYHRQGGLCAFCGVKIKPPSFVDSAVEGDEYDGHAHHFKPDHHGGDNSLDNCVYLCHDHHLIMGHAMVPRGIDNQGGSSRHWIKLSKKDFPFWTNKRKK